jgi:hypothetical protein
MISVMTALLRPVQCCATAAGLRRRAAGVHQLLPAKPFGEQPGRLRVSQGDSYGPPVVYLGKQLACVECCQRKPSVSGDVVLSIAVTVLHQAVTCTAVEVGSARA